MPDEVENLQEQVNLLAETLQKTLDFEKILAIAEGAEELSGKMPEALRKVTESEAAAKVRAAKPILAVAKDEAFCFFYRDNLELLASLGAKIEYFSPLSDEYRRISVLRRLPGAARRRAFGKPDHENEDPR